MKIYNISISGLKFFCICFLESFFFAYLFVLKTVMFKLYNIIVYSFHVYLFRFYILYHCFKMVPIMNGQANLKLDHLLFS